MIIKLMHKYLCYDVEQLIDQYARAGIDDQDKQFDANLRHDDEDPNDGDLIRRLVLTGCSLLRAILIKHLEAKAKDAIDEPGLNEYWEYKFKPGVNTDGQMLADLMHWAVVRLALSVWCRMQGFVANAESEKGEASQQIEAIQEALKRLAMPLKEGKRKPIPTDLIYVYYDKKE